MCLSHCGMWMRQQRCVRPAFSSSCRRPKAWGGRQKCGKASCVDSTAWQLQENHPSGESSSSLRKSTLTANHTSSLEKITLAALENLPCQQIILAVWKNHPGSLRKSPWQFEKIILAALGHCWATARVSISARKPSSLSPYHYAR
jgi:hypothetical protein